MVRKELITKIALLLLAGLLCGCGDKKDTDSEITAESGAVTLVPQDGVYAFTEYRNGTDRHVGPTPTPAPSPTPAPVQAQVPAGSDTSEPPTGGTVDTVAASGVTCYDISELESITYSADEEALIAEFYRNTVFTGDSVLLGFKNYCAKSSDPLLKNMKFLASGSYSLHNAFWEVSSKSIHPLYQGQQYPLWESIPMMGAERMFLFFGINDVAFGVEDSVSMYPLLIEKICDAAPGIDVTILSATYTLKGKGTTGLNNTNLAAFNAGAAATAAQKGWGYIDLATVLSDGEGNLAEKYCSDGELHENELAYRVWVMMIKAYAAERLGFGRGMETIN